ncbi:hypothetical protein ACA910_017943 [Epithemia clementina (nom. ined.)]
MDGESDDESRHIVSDDSHTLTSSEAAARASTTTTTRHHHHHHPHSCPLHNNNSNNNGAAKSVEGWNVFVRGLNEGAGEDDLLDAFSKFGRVQIVRLYRDRRTGASKCAVVEFRNQREAQNAINAMHGSSLSLLGDPQQQQQQPQEQQEQQQRIEVHWAFVNPTSQRTDYW